jgi:hypothetical protein
VPVAACPSANAPLRAQIRSNDAQHLPTIGILRIAFIEW